jgi:hypothetical protein
LLALGFSASALLAYGIVYLFGEGILGGTRSGTGARLAAAVVLIACAIVDTGVFGLRTPTWRRQTPRDLFYRFGASKGALLWGLDAGLVFTTFRVTSMSWASLAVSFLGIVPWWAGPCYAAGFIIPSALMVLAVPWRGEQRDPPEPVWLMNRIMDREATVRRLAPVVLAAAAVACLVPLFTRPSGGKR